VPPRKKKLYQSILNAPDFLHTVGRWQPQPSNFQSNMPKAATANAALTAEERRKRRRLPEQAWETGFTSQVERFHAGCSIARTELSAPFPSHAELEQQSAKMTSDETAMNELKECVSRARRILYQLHGTSGSPCKQWDFAAEDVQAGKVSLCPNEYLQTQFSEALESIDKAFINVSNAQSATLLDAAKQKTLEWVATERDRRRQPATDAAAVPDHRETSPGQDPTSRGPVPS
jgi:hypothetical protein